MLLSKSCLRVVYLASLFALFGCSTTPSELGIAAGEWHSYSQEKQQAILDNYRKINAENIAAAKHEKKSDKLAPTYLVVQVSDGKALMEPFINWQIFKPAAFNVNQDECTEVKLFSTENEKSINLRSCYKGNTLFIDPSRYDMAKKLGSVTINYSPLWQQGFVYSGINTYGYARLQNATFAIKLQERK
ncbi:MAG: hypothetical protein M1561_05340 [Gammaproteobacteria bacterium]|nr:hypothetical protein [Gammaproteobacteria bacterium]